MLLPSAAEGPKPVGQVEADSQTSPRPHTPTSGQQQTTPVGMMSWVSHGHLEAYSVFHLPLPSLKSHISTFACPAALPPVHRPAQSGGCEFLPTSEGARAIVAASVAIGGRWATGEEQLWAALVTQIEGDAGRLVNRHRCTDLSRTVCGRKGKVTLSQREGGDKVNNTCCVTEVSGNKEPNANCV